MTFEQFTKQQHINVDKYFTFAYDTPEFQIVFAFEEAAKNFDLYKGEEECLLTWSQLNKTIDLYRGMNDLIDKIILICENHFPRFIDMHVDNYYFKTIH